MSLESNKKVLGDDMMDIWDRVSKLRVAYDTSCCDENNPCCCNTFSPYMASPQDYKSDFAFNDIQG